MTDMAQITPAVAAGEFAGPGGTPTAADTPAGLYRVGRGRPRTAEEFRAYCLMHTIALPPELRKRRPKTRADLLAKARAELADAERLVERWAADRPGTAARSRSRAERLRRLIADLEAGRG